ncbi:hypothetical protein EVAR_43434_1 [Eumeta japonica]|uniref:Uncharacterized protein n=1 Tax=Eumeta variegata TaxID=151549 RepID=A0A4C1WTE8_EUMVA|nr:hypothetical protein EVAR_43434_1 [Eumeta japonica]
MFASIGFRSVITENPIGQCAVNGPFTLFCSNGPLQMGALTRQHLRCLSSSEIEKAVVAGQEQYAWSRRDKNRHSPCSENEGATTKNRIIPVVPERAFVLYDHSTQYSGSRLARRATNAERQTEVSTKAGPRSAGTFARSLQIPPL